MPAFSSGVAASLAPWIAADSTGQLAAFVKALGVMFDQVADLVTPTGYLEDGTLVPGWSVLLDPNNCPTQFLPYLSQFNGTGVPPGTADAAARSQIKAEGGFSRGTVAAIIAAAQRTLTGSQSVAVLERTGPLGADPYQIILIVNPLQVTSLAALTVAVNAVKPAGILLNIVQSTGWTIGQMEASYATISALEAAFVTIGGLENDQPGS